MSGFFLSISRHVASYSSLSPSPDSLINLANKSISLLDNALTSLLTLSSSLII